MAFVHLLSVSTHHLWIEMTSSVLGSSLHITILNVCALIGIEVYETILIIQSVHLLGCLTIVLGLENCWISGLLIKLLRHVKLIKIIID